MSLWNSNRPRPVVLALVVVTIAWLACHAVAAAEEKGGARPADRAGRSDRHNDLLAYQDADRPGAERKDKTPRNGRQAGVAVDESWGQLRGRFVYDGEPPPRRRLDTSKEPAVRSEPLYDESLLVDEQGGLANVLIFVLTKNVPVHPAYAASARDELLLTAKELRLEPHISLVRVTQSLRVHIDGPCPHNVNLALPDAGLSTVLPPPEHEYRFRKPSKVPLPVTCNIHGWEKAYVLVGDNPYMALTAADGTFEIRNLPVRELEFHVWHERRGSLQAQPEWKRDGTFHLTIRAGENDLGEIRVDPKLFDRN